jgi:hypothetical protein
MAVTGTHANQIHFLDVITGSAIMCYPTAAPTERTGRARGIKGGVTTELFLQTPWIAGGDDALPQSVPQRSLVKLQGRGAVPQRGIEAGAVRVGYCCNDGTAHVLELVWGDIHTDVEDSDVPISEAVLAGVEAVSEAGLALPEALGGLAVRSVCTVDLPADVFSSPVFFEGHLLIGCRDDHLYCLAIT